MKKTLPTLAAVAILLTAAGASADEAAVDTSENDGGYGYAFRDDPLQAGVSGASGAVIKLRSQVVRRTLIRPRASFVPEMLKSVETI
jgi:hypothetical protein